DAQAKGTGPSEWMHVLRLARLAVVPSLALRVRGIAAARINPDGSPEDWRPTLGYPGKHAETQSLCVAGRAVRSDIGPHRQSRARRAPGIRQLLPAKFSVGLFTRTRAVFLGRVSLGLLCPSDFGTGLAPSWHA